MHGAPPYLAFPAAMHSSSIQRTLVIEPFAAQNGHGSNDVSGYMPGLLFLRELSVTAGIAVPLSTGYGAAPLG